MRFETIGKPVRVGDESLVSISGFFPESSHSQVKILDSGKDFVIITKPDYTGYDRLFTKRLIKLCKVVNRSYVCLWRLCRENYISEGEYLYAYRLSLDAALVTVKPTLWIETNEP